jgi:predicted membrane chloride channel (bestrophin family)
MELTLEKGSVLAKPKQNAMQKTDDQQPRVSLPAYVLPLLVTLLLAFLVNLSYSLYWAGQMASNQANMVDTLRELKVEVRELRGENQRLREQVTALTASPSRR